MLLKFIVNNFSNAKLLQLHQTHINLGAQMIDFAGYSMPVMYSNNLTNQYKNCRSKSSFFDVSHMGQFQISGKDRLTFLQTVIVSDFKKKKFNESFLTLVLNQEGGIIDDCIVTLSQQKIFMVLNAANKQNSINHFQKLKKQLFPTCQIQFKLLNDRALIALQGPKAFQIIQNILDIKTQKMNFMTCLSKSTKQLGQLKIFRCGYTGQDGFQISIENNKAQQLFKLLCAKDSTPAGLGARDLLRIQAGLCLHSHQIHKQITPSQAGLKWVVKKQGFYYGKQAHQSKAKSSLFKRVGFEVKKGILRQGAQIFNEDINKKGKVTSGTYSPLLKKSIGMAYVDKTLKIGDQAKAKLNDREYQIKIVKMPFIPHKYYTSNK